MAASNSDDSSRAPDNFNISSSNEDDDMNDDDDDSRLSGTMEKCPLCAVLKRSFHCRDCVRSGDFVHSTHHLSERFADKQLRYANLKLSHGVQEKRCAFLLQNKHLTENLRADIKRKKENILTMQKLIADVKLRSLERAKQNAELLAKNVEWKKKLPKYRDNVATLSNCVEDRRDGNKTRERKYAELRDQLKQLIRSQVDKLTTFIFPINEVRSKGSSLEHGVPSTVHAIAEAAATCHVSGRWIVQDSHRTNELQHVIVAPSLPGNGSYLAYNDWVATNKDGVPTAVQTDLLSSANPAYKISAALTYTAQLVHLLSFYLDVRLPYKVVYGDFCKKELNEQQFTRKVARLNANILYLCYTQNVDLISLDPTHTLENIQKLLNAKNSGLGRLGPVEVRDTLAHNLDSLLVRDLQAGEDSESDDDNSLPNEWEAVSHLPGYEYGQPAATFHTLTANPQHSASMAGGLMTSAAASLASFWRGFTTK